MKIPKRAENVHRRAFHPFVEGLLNLAFPPICLGCGERVAGSDMILCLPCLRAVDRAEESEVEARMQRLPEVREAIDYAFSLWIFDKGGILQQVHHALKYGNRPLYGVLLGEILGAVLQQKYERRPLPEVIVPIPLHRTRFYERGYNQSERLAAGIARALGVPAASDLLMRGRSTASQTRLSRAERWKNLSGAFEVPDPSQVRDASILLVDDVLTTGATAGAAAQSLKQAGAFRVDLVTLAMART